MKANQQFRLTPAQVKEIRKMNRKSDLYEFRLVKDGRELWYYIHIHAYSWENAKRKLGRFMARNNLNGYEVFEVGKPDQNKYWQCDVDYNTEDGHCGYWAKYYAEYFANHPELTGYAGAMV